jgi:hypothetical protein
MALSPRLLKGSAFSPRSIPGLALWLDASDASTLFQDAAATTPATATSDPVGAWLDKSGNARHATQSTAGNRPVIHSATQNNRKILSFDGSNDALLGTGAQALKTGMTVIGAYFSGAVNYSSLFAVGDSAAGKRWISGSSLGKIGIDYYTNSASVSASASNRTGITSFTLNPSANSLGIRMDGAQVLSQASLSPALAAYTSDTFAVGTTPLANEQFFTGRVFELAVYNRVLSAAECRRVEQALGTKWGITLAPQVSNADAQDWVNRVYANGGTVSASTAAAVNTLCDSLDAASLRDRFYRLNLFCGTGLNAALVPLYRGPSLGGTQYGGATDTNNAFVGVGTDYAETGATGGLTGNGSTKYLNTGFNVDQLPGAANCHLSSFITGTQDIASARTLVGVLFNGTTDRYRLFLQLSGSTAPNYGIQTELGKANSAIANNRTNTNGGLILASRTSTTLLTLYDDAVSIGTTETSTAETTSASPFFVFARNGPVEYYNGRMAAYSIGAGMDAPQVTAYNTAMQAFQSAMGRV